MVIKSVNLETVCGITSKLPDNKYPEIAFAGKSNVGKSSLINAIMNRKSYARISSSPGKTQTINFYNINDALYLVDLPGYGYAQTGLAQRETLRRMIERYCLMREQLVCLFVLIDSRLKPQKIDLEFMQWLGENEVPFAIVFTKADKLGRGRLSDNIATYKQTLLETWEELPPIFCTSAETGTGRDEVLDYIGQCNLSIEQG